MEGAPAPPGRPRRSKGTLISETRTTSTAAVAPDASGLLADLPTLALTLDRFAGAFAALASLLGAAPGAADLARVRAADLLSEWPLLPDAECARGVGLLLDSATAAEDETQIRRDFNRLFYGPGPMIAPPYESVHRSDERLVFDHETLQVRAEYARFGLAAPRLNREPDDHLALELGFLATLCVRGMDAIDAGDDPELGHLVTGIATFLAEHLLVWGPTCLGQASAGAQTQFYRGVAALGLGTLDRAGAEFLPGR